MYKRLLSTGLVALALTIGSLFVLPVAQTATAAEVTSGQLPLGADEKCPTNWDHPTDINGKKDTKMCCPPGATDNSTKCFMAKYINPIINLLSGLVGIVVLISVIMGAIQYASSAGDSGKAAAGRQRIINSLLALAAFIFLYAFLQWLVPGGII